MRIRILIILLCIIVVIGIAVAVYVASRRSTPSDRVVVHTVCGRHNDTVVSVSPWVMRMYTSGSFFGIADGIDITIELSGPPGMFPVKARVAATLKRDGEVVRKSCLDKVVKASAQGCGVVQLEDVFESDARCNGQVLPLGRFVIDVTVKLEDGSVVDVHGMKVEIGVPIG